VSFDRLFFEMDSCISCGICSAVCPVERVMGASRAPILEPLFPAFGSRWDLYTCQELLAHCTQCGICQYNCPKNISIPEIITWAREDIRENKEELAPVKAMVRSLREEGNPFGTVIDKGVLIGKGVQPGEADYIFYPGCATLHQNPEVLAAWERVAEALGISYATVGEKHKCCGAMLLRWGYREEAEELAQANAALFSSLGRKGATIVSDCPHCVEAFRRDYPQLLPSFSFKVIHSSELLQHLLPEVGGGKEIEGTVAYFSPCFLQKGYGPNEPALSLTKALVPTVVLENQLCCGAGGGLGIINPAVPVELSRVILEQARGSGAETIVTACPHCRHHLREVSAGLPVLDIIELVVQVLTLE
jgi:Fe-S oxidoreductase